jgi:hypothetical protein
MPTWKWIVNGKEVFGDGPTEQEAWDNYRSARRVLDPAPEGAPRDRPENTPSGDLSDFGHGLVQGFVFDAAEGLGQMIERETGKKIATGKLRDWLKNFRDEAQKTWAGTAGEVTGEIGGLAVPGGAIARGTAAGAKVLGAGSILAPAIGRTLAGGVVGGLTPVEGAPNQEEFEHTKTNQMIGGGLASWALPGIARAASRMPTTGHIWAHNPWWSFAPALVKGAGRVAAPYLPESVAAVPAIEEDIRRREPLRFTVHPDSPGPPANPPVSIDEPPDEIIQP